MQKDDVLELIKDAMRAKDKARLSILRQVNEEFKKIEVDQRREVTEADVTACVKKLVKVTSETLGYSRQAGTDDDRTATLAQICTEGGYTSKKDMGKVMKALGEQTGGNFDKPEAAGILNGRLG